MEDETHALLLQQACIYTHVEVLRYLREEWGFPRTEADKKLLERYARPQRNWKIIAFAHLECRLDLGLKTCDLQTPVEDLFRVDLRVRPLQKVIEHIEYFREEVGERPLSKINAVMPLYYLAIKRAPLDAVKFICSRLAPVTTADFRKLCVGVGLPRPSTLTRSTYLKLAPRRLRASSQILRTAA